MQPYSLSILIIFSLLFAATPARAEEPVPAPVASHLPNIKASLDDGFFALAEQQARGVLRSRTTQAAEHEAALLLAQALWGQKRYTETINFLALYNGDPGFDYWRARAHFELKHYEASFKILDEAKERLAAGHYAPSALRLRGYIEQLVNRAEAAEASFLRFSKTFPDHPEWVENQFDLAVALIHQKKIPEAITIYEALIEESDSNATQRAQLTLAHVLYTQGAAENLAPARALLSGLARDVGARLAYRIDAYVDLAALEEKAGAQVAATLAMREAIDLSPDARQRVPLRLSLARMLLRAGDTADALRLLEQCRAEAPNEIVAAELQLEKSHALLQANQFREADEAYQVYLDVADDSAGLALAYFGKGLSLWELERYAEAATAFDKAVKEGSSERANALFKAGDAYYRAEKFTDAEKRYRAFVTDYPNHKNLPNALYQFGLSLAKIERRTEALATFQVIEVNHPTSPFAEKAALGSADVMRAGQQWSAALDKYTQVGQTYPDGSAAVTSLHQRGLILYKYLRRYADAKAAFEAVITHYPESPYAPQATYMRGFCLWSLGQVDEAVQTCLDFIEQYPDSAWTPEVMFWLAERYYNQAEYKKAEPLFMRIADHFKASALAPRALYRAGRSSAAQANYVVAIERYSFLAKTYSQSDVLPQTRFAQGDALSELGEFARGILAFEEIIKNYPESHLVGAAWGRKGDCQFSLASENPARYAEAMNSYQAILDRSSASSALKLQAEYKVGRCLEKTNAPDRAFNRYMTVVYTFINESADRSPYSTLWFTRAAFGAAALKERERSWLEAVLIYQRVLDVGVPAGDEAAKRIEKIKQDNWLLFEQAKEVE